MCDRHPLALASIILILLLRLAACAQDPAPVARTGTPTATAQSQRPTTQSPTPTPSSTSQSLIPSLQSPAPSLQSPTTQSPQPTMPPQATVGPSPQPPTPTPTRLNSLTIEAMRQRDYPGSEITIEETLQPGATYDRHIVSYLSDGYKIYALLTLPHGPRPRSGWPVIIFNHGYIPPQVYQTTEEYQPHIDTFARHGYIVLRPDYRGHGDSQGRARGAYGYPDYTVDVLNALASIQQYPDADPQRIGMWGHSMGGQITLRAMVVSPDIRAGVIWAGVVGSYPDLLTRWRRSGGFTPTPDPVFGTRGWRQRLIAQYGTPDENPDFWASISPNSYLAGISGPLQLHHGDADDIVPVELSQLLEAEMHEAGRYVDLWVYEGDDHNLNNWFAFAMEISLIFFERNVKNAGGA